MIARKSADLRPVGKKGVTVVGVRGWKRGGKRVG